MQMIAKDIQPFSIVDDEGFRNFLKVLDPRYTLPSRTTLQNVQMQNIYPEMTVKLQTILVKVDQCAITMDCWTSKANTGYLTITVLFIDEKFQLRSAMLSTQPLLCATNHSADNIASSLRAELINWYLLPKVCAIETDNASSMIKACELLEKRHLPCHAHCLNLVDKDSLSIKSIQANTCDRQQIF